MATIAEQLASVQSAIADIEANGQSVRRDAGGASRQLTMADLSTLYKREGDLKAALAAQQRAAVGGGRIGITYVTPV